MLLILSQLSIAMYDYNNYYCLSLANLFLNDASQTDPQNGYTTPKIATPTQLLDKANHTCNNNNN